MTLSARFAGWARMCSKRNKHNRKSGRICTDSAAILLRRDQIWFAEKNEKTMQTDIYALTEFSPRKGENIAKGYLQGRYGAIPHMRKELLRSV